jgi:hypothetical protein
MMLKHGILLSHTYCKMVSQFPFHYDTVLWVCALDELIDTEEIDHEFKRLGVPLKVLLRLATNAIFYLN